MEQNGDAVAYNLKKLREGRNLSLNQLSKLTGVSKSMLLQIESCKSSPTIATIWKIANGLKVSFTSLLKQPVTEAVVKPFKGAEPLVEEDGHYRIFLLVPFEPDRAFETYYVEIDPETLYHGEPHEGNVYEYLYVKSGTIQVSVNGEIHQVKENEFLQFYANCPHYYENIGDEMASAILQISYLP